MVLIMVMRNSGLEVKRFLKLFNFMNVVCVNKFYFWKFMYSENFSGNSMNIIMVVKFGVMNICFVYVCCFLCCVMDCVVFYWWFVIVWLVRLLVGIYVVWVWSSGLLGWWFFFRLGLLVSFLNRLVFCWVW